jgi:hypothetical protein
LTTANPNNPETMPMVRSIPRGGALVVAAVWLVAGVLHTWIGATGGGAVAFVLAVVSLVGVVLLIAASRPEVLIAAAVAGAVGVAVFAVPFVVPMLGIGTATPDPADVWGISAFLADALTVRLAVFTLRRANRPGKGTPSQRQPSSGAR